MNNNQDRHLYLIFFIFLFFICLSPKTYSNSEYSNQDDTYQYTVNGLLASITYYFVVTAYDDYGRESHYSNMVSASGVTEFTLSWGKVPQHDSGGHKVYIKKSSEDDYTLSVNLPIKSMKTNKIEDNKKNGTCFILSMSQ